MRQRAGGVHNRPPFFHVGLLVYEPRSDFDGHAVDNIPNALPVFVLGRVCLPKTL